MKSIRPPVLGPNKAIGIVSVAAPEPATNIAFFERGISALQKMGHKVVLSAHACGKHGYVSATASEIAADLHEMFLNPIVGAIVCAGGGINANKVIRHLNFDLLATHPKPLVGVSNPTVILNAITARTGLMTFHGPSVVWDFGSESGLPELTSASFWHLITTTDSLVTIDASAKWSWLRPGTFKGRLLGGNLTSIQALLGTENEPTWQDSVLFWEDIAKPVNRLDMMLSHFRDAGVLDQLSGMIVGQLVSCEPSEGVTYQEMLLEVLGDYNFPILTEVPLGHTAEKLSLPIGAIVSSATGEGLKVNLGERPKRESNYS